MVLGENLAKARKQTGYSLHDVAHFSGEIARILNDKRWKMCYEACRFYEMEMENAGPPRVERLCTFAFLYHQPLEKIFSWYGRQDSWNWRPLDETLRSMSSQPGVNLRGVLPILDYYGSRETLRFHGILANGFQKGQLRIYKQWPRIFAAQPGWLARHVRKIRDEMNDRKKFILFPGAEAPILESEREQFYVIQAEGPGIEPTGNAGRAKHARFALGITDPVTQQTVPYFGPCRRLRDGDYEIDEFNSPVKRRIPGRCVDVHGISLGPLLRIVPPTELCTARPICEFVPCDKCLANCHLTPVDE